MGCGASLVLHAQEGAEVTMVALSRDETDPTGAGFEAAERAAEFLGARLVVDEAALDDAQRRIALLERLVRDLVPQVVYLPASDELHPVRREAFRIGRAVTGDVPMVLGYQTATTGMDFRPTRFRDVGEAMVDKMEARTAYQSPALSRPDLAPRLAQAYARYWGRLERFLEVEAFEVLRG